MERGRWAMAHRKPAPKDSGSTGRINPGFPSLKELEDELGRRPSIDEWAAAVGLEKRELRKRMRRANSARDLMVAANSKQNRIQC